MMGAPSENHREARERLIRASKLRDSDSNLISSFVFGALRNGWCRNDEIVTYPRQMPLHFTLSVCLGSVDAEFHQAAGCYDHRFLYTSWFPTQKSHGLFTGTVLVLSKLWQDMPHFFVENPDQEEKPIWHEVCRKI